MLFLKEECRCINLHLIGNIKCFHFLSVHDFWKYSGVSLTAIGEEYFLPGSNILQRIVRWLLEAVFYEKN